MGKVYLIGAGPGNEELITLRAVRLLQECTAVLYDRLAGEHVLKHLNKECKIFYCGKQPGCHYKTQDEINAMLINLAEQGHIVGRIKGGDPYVFGRGGEEGEALFKKRIEFEVVPGITSAVSALSYAGIPVTSRGYSQGFHVFTGMSAEKLEINWDSAANIEGTLIFLMGVQNLEAIIDKLVSAGKDINTPSAVVMRGTTSKQKTVKGTLKDIAEKVRVAGLKSPSIIVIGEVVRLSEILNWYERKPLFGVNVCVTRTKEQAASLKNSLFDLGAEVTEINAIEIEPIKNSMNEFIGGLSIYDYLILTSVNSVNCFFDELINKKVDIRTIKAKFAVVGSATEKALLLRGVVPQIKADEFTGEKLCEKMLERVKQGEKVLIPSSKATNAGLWDYLKTSGAEVDIIPMYEPVIGKVNSLNNFEEIDIILYTSPSIVRNMIEIAGLEALKAKKALAIGPITQKELERNEIECIVSEESSNEGMINKLLEIYKK